VAAGCLFTVCRVLILFFLLPDASYVTSSSYALIWKPLSYAVSAFSAFPTKFIFQETESHRLKHEQECKILRF
jgi:hypothetical protein